MQKCMNKMAPRFVFALICYDLWGPRASQKQLRRGNPKRPQKVKPGVTLLVAFGYFCIKAVLLCILLASIFMLFFGIAFGRRPPAASLWILKSFHGPCWGHFAHSFADAAKL